MKRFAALLVAVILSAAVTVGLCACDSDHVHVYGQEVVKEATCYSEGEVRLVCMECGDVRTITMPVVPHSFTVWEVVNEATCTESGLWTRECTMCKMEQEGIIPARGHEYGEWKIEEPTCELNGSMLRVCARCGQGEGRVIGALGHAFSETYTVDKHPTMTEDGQRSRHCIHPGCDAVTDIEVIPRLGAK